MVYIRKIAFSLFIVSGFVLAPLGAHAATPNAERLAGRILLQVEEKGKAWYVEPLSKTRAYLGRPADAFRAMRELGLGITTSNLENIASSDDPSPGDRQFAQRFRGRILLQVQSSGEAWYVNPVDLKRYYLGRPSDAFVLMRKLGLGVSNNDLMRIPLHKRYGDQGESVSPYYDINYGFTLGYPKEWTRKESDLRENEKGEKDIITFKTATSYVVIKDKGLLEQAFRSLKPDFNFEKYYKDAFDKYGDYYDNSAKYNKGLFEQYYENALAAVPADEIVSTQRITHYGDDAYFIESRLGRFKFYEMVIFRESSIYSIEYGALVADYDQHVVEAKKLIQSFQFVPASQLPFPVADTMYEHKETGVRFLIPSGFKRIESPGSLRIVSRAFSVEFTYIADKNQGDKSLEEYIRTFGGARPEEYDVISTSSTMLGGLLAIRESKIRTFEGRVIQFVGTLESETVIAAKKDNTIYSLSMRGGLDEKTRDRLLPVFEQMVNSFSFVQ